MPTEQISPPASAFSIAPFGSTVSILTGNYPAPITLRRQCSGPGPQCDCLGNGGPVTLGKP